jgi:hypothetical protein
LQTPIVITEASDMIGGAPVQTLGSIGDYAVYAPGQESAAPSTVFQFFYKTTSNVWVVAGGSLWKLDWPTIEGTESNPVLDAGDTFNLNLDGDVTFAITVPDAGGGVGNVAGVAGAINGLGLTYLAAAVRNGKLCIFEDYPEGDGSPARFITITAGSGTVLDDLGIDTGTYYQPLLLWGTGAQQPLWQAGQANPRPTGSVWMKAGGTGLNPVVKEWSNITEDWAVKTVPLAISDAAVNATLDPTGGQAIPAGTVYAQYNFNNSSKVTPVNLWKRIATGPTVVTGTNTAPDFSSLGPAGTGPYALSVTVSSPNGTLKIGRAHV